MQFLLQKVLIILSLLSLQPKEAIGQANDWNSKILWLTIEEASQKSELDGRKIILFLYTDWCTWCKKMEMNSLNNEEVADYINRNYYPVKFNAESREAVVFQGQTYSYKEQKPRGVHELVSKITNGRICYPTLAFFDENWKVIQAIPYFQPPSKLEQIITYFAENHYRKVPWSSYQQMYQPLKSRNPGY